MRGSREWSGTSVGDRKTQAIANHNVIRIVIRGMNKHIAQVSGNMVWCTTIEKPTRVFRSSSSGKICSWLPMLWGLRLPLLGRMRLSLLLWLRNRSRSWSEWKQPIKKTLLSCMSLCSATLTFTQIRTTKRVITLRSSRGAIRHKSRLWSGWHPQRSRGTWFVVSEIRAGVCRVCRSR